MQRWLAVDWLPLLSTLVGGGVALLGSVLAHTLRSRDERRRIGGSERRQSYVAYLVAMDKAHGRLRVLAEADGQRDDGEVDVATQATHAFGDAGLYQAREMVLLAGSTSVVGPAESALRQLAVLRDAVGAGARLHTAAFHDAYHPFAEALWRLRSSIRLDLGSTALTPDDLDKPGWDDKANCDFCEGQGGVVPSQAAAAE
jgi:hypothetical protein